MSHATLRLRRMGTSKLGWLTRALRAVSEAWLGGTKVLAVVLLVVGYVYARHGDFNGFAKALAFGNTWLHDYRWFYAPMGRPVLAGSVGGTEFLYGPIAAAGFACLAVLGEGGAALSWVLVSCALTLALVPLASKLSWGRWDGALALCAALILWSVPAWHCLRFGQVSTMLVAIQLAAIWAYNSNYRSLSAILIGLATSIKFYPAVFALMFAVRRDWKSLATFAVMCIVSMTLLPVLFLGVEQTFEFYRELLSAADSRLPKVLRDVNSQSLQSIVPRIARHYDVQLSSALSLCLRVVLTLSWLAYATWLCAKERSSVTLGGVALFLSTPLWVVTSWPHYFVYLPVCQVVLLGRALPGSRDVRWWVVILAMVASAASTSLITFDLVGDRIAFVRAGVFLFANGLAMFALVVGGSRLSHGATAA